MSDSPLARLAERTRELVSDLEASRADVLSVADLNRAMRQLLRNQAAILDALSAPGSAPSAPAPRVAAKIVVTPAAPHGSTNGAAMHDVADPSPATHRARDVEDVGAPDPEAAHASDAPPAADAGQGLAELVLQESRVLPGHLARGIVEEFDNRDKSYEKGLDKLNRWVSGGAGTPFQWRGDRAYLNLNGAGPTAVKNYEEQLMSRMGFSRRLGRLVVPGLQGEVIIYERPS